MDNEHDQSKVAYENGPKEVNTKRGMPNTSKQFGKGNKMVQDSKSSAKSSSKENSYSRHKEHR